MRFRRDLFNVVLVSLLLGVGIGLPLGIYSAVLRGTPFDYLTRVLSILASHNVDAVVELLIEQARL